MKDLSEEKRAKITNALKRRYELLQKMEPDHADLKLTEAEFVEKYFAKFAVGQQIFGYILLGMVVVGVLIAIVSSL